VRPCGSILKGGRCRFCFMAVGESHASPFMGTGTGSQRHPGALEPEATWRPNNSLTAHFLKPSSVSHSQGRLLLPVPGALPCSAQLHTRQDREDKLGRRGIALRNNRRWDKSRGPVSVARKSRRKNAWVPYSVEHGELQPQLFFQTFHAIPSHCEFGVLTIVQAHHQTLSEPGMQFLYEFEIDDG
jgi:hypothetical protein